MASANGLDVGWLTVLGLALVAGWWFLPQAPASGPAADKHPPLIGVVQLTDNDLLDITRDSFVGQMKDLGYVDGVNCRLALENGHGDMPTVNMILDKFLKDGASVVVAVSTGAAQAALKKITDRPLVFATVANPFIINAGKSDTEHLPNVTGVYGWTPMDKTLAMVRQLFPGPLRVGAVWDPSQANAVFNVDNLKQAIAAYPDLSFRGATVAGSGDVYQAVQSLVSQGVDVLVLPTDNIVYSAFDAVLAAARSKKTPIVISDVERLADGALLALGFDYTSSGQQAARLVDRILKGESPRDIPFERYSRLTVGFNLNAAAYLGLTIPPDLLAQATLIHPQPKSTSFPPAPRPAQPAGDSAPPAKRLAIFLFADTPIILDTLRGVQEELRDSGALAELGLDVTVKSAQGEMALGQAIAQDLVRQKFDHIVTLSTIALQLSSKFNKTIPQVFGAVTDPYRTGVAKSPGEHQPNITGVATLQPVEAVIRTAREVFPRARRIGMAWNPGELSSEACTMLARQSAPRHGFTLVEANVTSTADIMEAVQSLLLKDVDLFLISGDSTMLSAFESVAKVLGKARVPLLSNSCSDIGRGAFLAVGPDYYHVGRRTGALALRVLKGEPVQGLPIEDYVPETLCLNRDLAAAYGVTLPGEVARRAAQPEGGR
jgi:putative ABC transport system permease protein